MKNLETFLLDKNYKSILEIINQVSKQPTREISFSELEDKLSITKKTIKTYLDILLDYCDQKNLETFTLHKGKLKMIMDTNFNIFDLYHHFTQTSIKYQIIMSIFEKPQITFTDLYLDLALSKSNASLHIKQINHFLKPYQCKISFLQNRPLQGEEHQIRFLYYNLLWGLNLDKITGPCPKLDQITTLLLEIIPDITYVTLSKIKLGFYIFQVACKSGYFITSEKQFILQDSPFITYDDFFQRIDALDFLSDCPDLQTKQKESRYLYFLFCRANILTFEECKKYEHQVTPCNSPTVQYFVTKFQEKSRLSLEQYEITYLNYNLSLFNKEAAIFTGRAKTFDLEEMIDRYNTNGGNISKIIQKFINDLCNDNGEIKKLIQKFPSLHDYYTMLLRVIAAKHHPPMKLLVQSSISSLHRQALITQIINSTSFPIVIYTSEQLNGRIPDGIISNWIPEEKFRDIPFFSTSLFYTEWHKGELDLFLKRLETELRNYK